MSKWAVRFALGCALIVTSASLLLNLVVWLGVRSGRLPGSLLLGEAQINLLSLLDAFTALATAVVGALIVHNRPGNRLGWAVLMLGFSLGLSGFSLAYAGLGLSQPADAWPGLTLAAWVSQVVWFAIFLSLELLVLLFPTGRFLSPRWRWVGGAALFATVAAMMLLAVGTPIDVPGGQIVNPIGMIPFDWVVRLIGPLFGLFMVTLALALIGMVLRFRQAASVERLQIKWLLYASAVFLAGQTVSFLTYSDWGTTLTSVAALGLPIAIGIAVLRYHLYDIDIIIRKTLQYTVVTGLLALIYFGSVFLLQRLFSSLTGQQSPLILVVSTLLIAALFAPLRRRIQDAIDRRFYRKKYDAQQVLAQFARTARDETDLNALLAELERVIQDTLQPEHVSVWLKMNPKK